MRLLDYLTGFISLLALPFIAWWGVNQSPQSAARLEARLEAEAQRALQSAGIDWARVEMDGQTAILSGASPSEDAVPEAASLVLRSSGAGGLLFGGVSQVETRVASAAPVWPYVWSAQKTPEGGFVLSGHVPSKAARAALLLEAQAIGKGPVEDRMVLAAGAPEGNWQGISRFAIGQLAEMDSGSVLLENHVLTLRGDVPDDELRARLAETTNAVAAPFRGVALVRGVPLWSAALANDGLVLSGAVPAEADRRTLLTQARRTFAGPVVDQMTLSDAAPVGWTAGASAGLAHLAAFQSGSLAFDPVAGGFIIEGEAPASTLQFLTQDMTRSAGTWRVVIATRVRAPAAETASLTVSGEGAAASCEDQLNEMLDKASVSFAPGQAEFDRDSAPALDRFAAIAGRCDPLVLQVGGDALDEARATLIADYLERVGVRRPHLAAIGYGTPAGPRGKEKDEAAPPERALQFMRREQSGQ